MGNFLPWLLALLGGATVPPLIDQKLQVRIPMRDGVRLAANIFRPASPGAYPTLLVRTPYGKGKDLLPNYRPFVEHGYALLVQDVRGRYDSEGAFDPLNQEGRDGDDTLYWIAAQSWSNGKIGMLGGSYLGIVQWRLAELNNPHLKAIFPVVSGDDDYFDRFYSRGGALKLGHRLLWLSANLRLPGTPEPRFGFFTTHLPVRTADRAATGQSIPMYQKATDHPAYDAFWKGLSTREKLDRIKVPVFSVGGWYDNYVEGDLEAFSELRRLGREAHTLIGPWPHNMSIRFPGVDFGPDSMQPIRDIQIEWFDRWLKDAPPTARTLTPLRVFVMGANRWRTGNEWPPKHTLWTPFYLSDSGLSPKIPRKESLHRYLYDPHDPVPTRGGAVCCNPQIFPWGPIDQRPLENRKDVLVYSTLPLKKDTEVTGPIRVNLWVATTAPDTDFTAKLIDVFPDGVARNLCDGILRLRYRYSLDKPALAKPGEIYPISIQTGVTSNLFRAGHSIRVEISSSNFPRFDRNLNTGRPVEEETEMRSAQQAVYFGGKRPSHLLLPIQP